MDLRGWRNAEAAKARWQVNDWQLTLKTGDGAAKHTLWTEAEFDAAEFTFDVKPGKAATGDSAPTLVLRGREGQETELKIVEATAGKWSRVRIQTTGTEAIVWLGEKEVQRATISAGKGSLGLKDTGAATDFGNLHIRRLRVF
jgi:hypothetical protein